MSDPVKIDPGPRPELTWLSVDRLDVDPAYQRSMESTSSKRLIKKIAENFCWASFQAILAAPSENDRWLIIDGQHRVAAARTIGVSLLPAVVIRDASLADQAEAFVGANRDRVAVSAQSLFHARVAAEDPEAISVKGLCDAAGIELLPHAPPSIAGMPAGKTGAVGPLLQLVRRYGEDVAAEAIRAVAGAFGTESGALRGQFFLAAGLFLKEGGRAEQLLAALRALGWRRLVKEISTTGGPHAMAIAMVPVLREAGNLSQAKTGDSAAIGGIAAGVDPASRLAGGRTPALGPQGRTQGEAQTSASGVTGGESAAPSPRVLPRAPFKSGPLPAMPEKKRAGEEDAIAKFLAEKGASLVMGPEQVAAFLRDSGHKATIREAEPQKGRPASSTRRVWKRKCFLDGKPVEMIVLYDIANQLRIKAGLKPVALPAEAVAA